MTPKLTTTNSNKQTVLTVDDIIKMPSACKGVSKCMPVLLYGLEACTLNKVCAWRHDIPPTPCKLTISSHLFARWHLFRHVGHLRHQQQVDL